MSGGYSVYAGMDLESGDLLAIYEWSFQPTKKTDSRRVKQVRKCIDIDIMSWSGGTNIRLILFL